MPHHCWEAKNCPQEHCAVRARRERHCWLSEPRVCFDGEHRTFRDRLSQCCQRCVHFHRSIGRSTGRRTAEHVFGDTLYRVMAELTGYQSELVAINQALKQKISGLSILDQVSKALQSTLDQNQIFHIILTGVTAADILSLNRAFLFLVDETGETLQGVMAVGPNSPEQATLIWDELERSRKTFLELALVPHGEILGNDHVNALVQGLRLGLADQDSILARAVREKKSFLIADAAADPATCAVSQRFGAGSFALVPLVADNEPLGLLMADNAISGVPITEADLVLMGIFAGQAAAAIKIARLYARLQDKVRELADSQEKLLKAERMAAIGEVATTLAHEIRTPLVSIGGFINALVAQQPANHPRQEQLGIIRAEIERLESVLSDTLEMARFKDPVLTRTDINALIRNCLQLLEPECQAKGIAVQLELEPALPLLWLDMQQFPQVLLNILKNAIHAMPDGGLITVRGRLANDRDLELSINDTGQGIPAAVLPHIFEPKFTTKKYGLGIGLAVSKKIVEGHRGTIQVQSAERRGTTFVIIIPVRS